jgi:hypothetical protein
MSRITVNDGIPDEGVLHRHGIEESVSLLKVTGFGKRRNKEVPRIMGFVRHGVEQLQGLISVA